MSLDIGKKLVGLDTGKKSIDERFEKEFRNAYAVLYRDEEEIRKAMGEFDRKRWVIPEISEIPDKRRGWVERYLSRKLKDGDALSSADAPYHFSDIKYFLGDSPIDVMFYRTAGIRMGGNYQTGKLIRTALDNVDVKFRLVTLSIWDDNELYDQVSILQSIMNLGAPQLPVVRSVDTTDEKYKGPLLIVEDVIEYGRKHQALLDFLDKKELGLWYDNFVFNFVGRKVFDPFRPESHSLKNGLTLL